MTTRQKIEQMLYNHGIFESMAVEIMDFSIPKIEAELQEEGTTGITWNRPAREYPDVMYDVLFLRLKKFVVEWAETNKPQAFWIPMFK